MRVGILGGTFNPPHIGHLILAQTAQERLRLGKVLFIPTNHPPHKNSDQTSPRHRLKMTRLATQSNSHFRVLDWEIKRGGVSFTIDTLRVLHKKFPRDIFYLLIGSDLANEFSTWKDYRDIHHFARIVAVPREDAPLKRGNRFLLLDVVHVNITSSLVRRYAKEGFSVKYLVPPKVFGYIRRNRLYTR